MKKCFSLLAASGLVLLAVPAHAGEHAITQAEVEAFFAEVRDGAVEMMGDPTPERFVAWTERNIADGATVQASFAILRDGEAKGFASISLDRDDVLRIGGLFLGALQGQEPEAFEVDFEVLAVTPHGSDTATVSSRWTERIALAAPAADGEAAPDAEPAQFTLEERMDCTQLIHRDGERLQMGVMTCTGEVRF